MNLKLTLLCCFLVSFAFGQKEGAIWYFGKNLGLDFTNRKPVLLKDSAMNTYEGSATISDGAGKVLFYTDGMQVWNGEHKIMANGEGLKGHFSATQSAIIVPKPKSEHNYYIFTIDAAENKLKGGLKYSEVDMQKNEGLGEVVKKNHDLISPTCEKITAIMHRDSVNYWVITHGWGNNVFYAFLVTEDGINPRPVISKTGTPQEGDFFKSAGYMKASPNGTRVAITFHGDKLVELFEFDNERGAISNATYLPPFKGLPYGLEFSPNGNKLYVSTFFGGEITQYDVRKMEEARIEKSKYIVRKAKGKDQTGALQLGPDGKIYVSDFGSSFMPAITRPNGAGEKCKFNKEYIALPKNSGRLGLPSFIQSFFVKEPIKRVITQEEIEEKVIREIPDITAEETIEIPKKTAQKHLKIEVFENVYEIPNDPNSKVVGTSPVTIDRLVGFIDHSPMPSPPVIVTGGNTCALTPNENYYFNITKEGYLTKKVEFSTTNYDDLEKMTIVKVILDKVFLNKEILFQDILFEFDEATFLPQSYATLNSILNSLKANPGIEIFISAHTDCRGNDTYNMSLSESRASAVAAYLTSKGINSSRLKFKGLGESKPIIDCDCTDCTEAEHQLNRSARITITKN